MVVEQTTNGLSSGKHEHLLHVTPAIRFSHVVIHIGGKSMTEWWHKDKTLKISQD